MQRAIYFSCRPGKLEFTNSTTTSRTLTREGVDGNPLYYENSDSNNAIAQRIDYDFDLTFQTPQIIRGKFIFNFTMRATGSGGTLTGSAYTVITVNKVAVGGAETALGTQTSPTISEQNSTRVERHAMELDVNQTPFAIGEKLRITVQFYTGHGGVGTTTARLYFDPENNPTDTANVTGLSYDTDFAIYTPFKINQ